MNLTLIINGSHISFAFYVAHTTHRVTDYLIMVHFVLYYKRAETSRLESRSLYIAVLSKYNSQFLIEPTQITKWAAEMIIYRYLVFYIQCHTS